MANGCYREYTDRIPVIVKIPKSNRIQLEIRPSCDTSTCYQCSTLGHIESFVLSMNTAYHCANVSHPHSIHGSDLPSYSTACSYIDSRYYPSHPIPTHFSGTSVCHANGSVTRISLVVVRSHAPSYNIQISPNQHTPTDAFLRPGCPFKLAPFSVRMLMRIG